MPSIGLNLSNKKAFKVKVVIDVSHKDAGTFIEEDAILLWKKTSSIDLMVTPTIKRIDIIIIP